MVRRVLGLITANAVFAAAFLTFGSTPASAAPTPALIHAIKSWQWNPPSPDNSGIAYIPSIDRFQVADSEVEETTGAGYHGVSTWQITRAGVVTNTGTMVPFTKEPTGLGYDPATNTLFVSSDSGQNVYIEHPGGDGLFGTSDDSVKRFNLAGFGLGDAEDVAYDTNTGHLWMADGLNRALYEIDPRSGGFGNGDDVVTRHNIAAFMDPKDSAEGLGFDPATNTLIVGDQRKKALLRITEGGSLVETINLAAAVPGLIHVEDIALAPASDSSGRTDYYIVDRGVDNGPAPSENDGMIWEVSLGSTPVDALPSVSITSPASGAAVRGTVTVTANASDDHGVMQVRFSIDGATIGTDTNGADGWSVPWNTNLTSEGVHTLTATATDTALQTASTSRKITVDRTAPSVAISTPGTGATVQGTVAIHADASDGSGSGVSSVRFSAGGTSIGTDTNGANGWSVSWATASVPDGLYTITATAIDGAANATTSTGIRVAVNGGGGVLTERGPGTGYGWARVADRRAAGGSYLLENRAGASATFPFIGGAVSLFAISGPAMGRASIAIDGTPMATFGGYAPSFGSHLAHRFTGLGGGAHTLTVTVLGTAAPASSGTRVGVDAIRADGTLRANPVPASGAWGAATVPEAIDGTYVLSGVAGSSARLRFTGSAATWITATGPTMGRAQIWVDGHLVRTVDLSATVRTLGAERTVSGLSAGSHVMRIVVLGSHGASGTGTSIVVDGWIVG